MTDTRPQLRELHVADPPERWAALGFAVDADAIELGGVTVRLGGEGRGITRWVVDGIAADGEIDGLPTGAMVAEATPPPQKHPNGALAIDHFVAVTPDFERTVAALAAAGIELSRVRDAGGFRQGFKRLGPAILELVEAKTMPAGPAAFWGLVVIVEDLDALAQRLGELLGSVKPAVQPGRRIATLKRAAGLSPQVAFMDPEAR